MTQETTRLQQRMYGLVPYNISPIQQGIQFGHAVVEYGLAFGDYPEYQDWANLDKTFIILNGGTTNKRMTGNFEFVGTLNKAEDELVGMGTIRIATFSEPDLGDQLTAVVFLVDERVYDYKKYPTYDEFVQDPIDERNYYFDLFGVDADTILEMREFLSKFRLA